MSELSGYEHIFIAKGGPRTLLLLHGTGGGERDLVPVGEELDPFANLLAPRGNVLEGTMARFFKRKEDQSFDEMDLGKRTGELTTFVRKAAGTYAFDLAQLVGVGFSNGANMLLRLACIEPGLFKEIIAFRGMPAALPENLPDMTGVRVFLAAGVHDRLVPLGDAERLEQGLLGAGARVTTHRADVGHNLTQGDILAAAKWLNEKSA